MINYLVFYYLWFAQLTIGQTIFEKPQQEPDYRFAKYVVPVNFLPILDVAPGVPPVIYSYKYYIEYGNDVVIEIIDPGFEVEYLPVVKSVWNYKDLHLSMFAYHRDRRIFYNVEDSLKMCIDEPKFKVGVLCGKQRDEETCDTVTVDHIQNAKNFTLWLDINERNIQSTDLFYPDVHFLPKKIFPQDGRAIWTLEGVYFGKMAVDSLLNQYVYEGYRQITEEEAAKARLEFPIDETKKMIPISKQ